MSFKGRVFVVVLCAAGSASAAEAVSVRVVNPLPTPRGPETVALKLSELKKLTPALESAKTVIVDASGALVDSQLVDMDGDESPDELVFQASFAANEAKNFSIQTGQPRPPTREQFKVYGRFVRERHDDFAWENDRVAHRMYGPDLENWKKEPLTSSGVDVWCKRTKKLVVNDWYMLDNYHQDNGEGADLYSVGKSRGCGGTGVWQGGKLYVSRNFTSSRVLANGPIRLVFELNYAPWDAGGVQVSETKRITLDAGSNFDRFESTFKTSGQAAPVSVAIGIAKHKGSQTELDKKAGSLRSWEPLKEPNGNLGCGVVVSPSSIVDFKETELDSLVITRSDAKSPTAYYVGSSWDRGGNTADAATWAKQLQAFTRGVAAPLRISLSSAQHAAAVQDKSEKPWSVRTCDSIMREHPQVLTDEWHYDTGLVLQGFDRVWVETKDRKYIDYVKQTIDRLVDADGKIAGYKPDNYSSDDINMGKLLFSLLAYATEVKDKQRYTQALGSLRSQMQTHPRTSDGAFWHKKVYPNQMWLDGVFMTSPFLAEYAATFNEPALFNDVTKQILLAEKHMRDAKTGLLYHGWDERKEQRWANPKTGTSPEFWGRAVGWYAMGIVDTLTWLPKNHPQRAAVIAVLGRLAAAVAAVQDPPTGVWWQVLDAGTRAKNYREASASAMFVYALSKGVHNGWLDKARYEAVAARGYQGILKEFVAEESGQVSLKSICKVAGLGGNPYRDGTYDYYTSTQVVTNDPKGVGAFILASTERE